MQVSATRNRCLPLGAGVDYSEQVFSTQCRCLVLSCVAGHGAECTTVRHSIACLRYRTKSSPPLPPTTTLGTEGHTPCFQPTSDQLFKAAVADQRRLLVFPSLEPKQQRVLTASTPHVLTRSHTCVSVCVRTRVCLCLCVFVCLCV